MQHQALYSLANAGAAWLSPALMFLLLLSVNSATPPTPEDIKENLIQRFQTTTGEALYEMWHGQCFRRCRSQLVDHVNMACQNDPYRMGSRRSLPDPQNASSLSTTTAVPPQLTLQHEESAAFLEKKSAGRARARTDNRGIMNECCYDKPCNWEEYAEYCHGYNRRPNSRPDAC